MSGADLIPQDTHEPDFVDAEFEEVRDDHGGSSPRTLLASLWAEAVTAGRNLLMIAGGVMLLIIIIVIINPDASEDAAGTQAEAAQITAEAEALAAQADALAADVEADFANENSFDTEYADLNAYAIAEAGTACASEPIRQLLSAALHDHMTAFLTTSKPGYLSGINRMIPPVRPAVAQQFLDNASMEWEREPVQATWDIFGDDMHLQCEGSLSLEIPRFKDDGTAAVFRFRPLAWAIIFPTDLSGDLQVMIHDRPEEYGSKVFLDTAGQTFSLGSINSLSQ